MDCALAESILSHMFMAQDLAGFVFFFYSEWIHRRTKTLTRLVIDLLQYDVASLNDCIALSSSFVVLRGSRSSLLVLFLLGCFLLACSFFALR